MNVRPNTLSARSRILLAAGVVASMVPFSGSAAGAAPAPARAAEYGGYTTTAWAAPIRVEVYEPSIPIPATPQLEFEMGYSKVRADTGSSNGRASFFWPGDPVGEGLKTFAEQLGLPAQLFAGGYPVQVNSQYPGDGASEKDEPFPGMVMRTTSGDRTAVAETGFSPDSAVLGPDAEAEKAPAAPATGLATLQDQITKLFAGGLAPSTRKAAMVPSIPGLPAPVGALVDLDGYVSVSKMDASKGPVVGASRAVLGEIRLLGGLITMHGLETVARARSDGAKGEATGKSAWGGMSIAGQKFEIGPDGLVAAGRTSPVPGLNQLPLGVLETLGVKIEVPEQTRTVEGDLATSVSEGLRITIDTKVLAPVLKALPGAALAELIPPEAGPLKGIVSGLSNLAPRVVITLGVASATVDTVPAIAPFAPPPATGGDGGGTDAAAPPSATGGGAAGGAGTPPAVGGAPPAADAAGGTGETPVDALVDAAPASAGLPALFSIPGLLMIGAFAAAAVAGSWFRRLGAAALGGGAACPHGLDSGLPDLRKA